MTDAEKIRVLREALQEAIADIPIEAPDNDYDGWDNSGDIYDLGWKAGTWAIAERVRKILSAPVTAPRAHVTRYSDSTFYDEVCVNCGATDANGMGALNAPCPAAPRDSSAPGETWQPDPQRCPICEWPYAAERKDGCVPGDCSYRPDDHDRKDRERIDRNRARYTVWKNAQPAAGEGGE